MVVLRRVAISNGLTVLLGCDRKHETPAVHTPTSAEQHAAALAANRRYYLESRRADLPGVWEASLGADAFHSTMTLELRPDGTFKLTNVMHGSVNAEMDVTNVSEGHWQLGRELLTLSLERSADGRPISDDRKEENLMLFPDWNGEMVGRLCFLERGTSSAVSFMMDRRRG